MKSKTPWRQKLHSDHSKIVRVPPRWRKQHGNGTMLIPRPLDVDALMRRIRRGRLATVTQLRERLARDAGTDVACPLTTGIFVRIAAEASEEARRAGDKRVTPWWRVVGAKGEINRKMPQHAARLRAEGHRIAAGRVADFADALQRLA